MPTLAVAVFFASGFATLVYQVTWQRLLVLFAGADVVSTTIVVSAFMAGLGLGNMAGGVLADRRSPLANIRLFAAAELAIGAFGLASKPLFYDLLYARLGFLSGSVGAGLVLFAALLWPTFFMGLSLPLLARALTPSLASAGRVVGTLYGWNTLGAALGALIATWSLVPRHGLTGTIAISAAINVLCAIAARWLLAPRAAAGPAASADARISPASVPQGAANLPPPAWAAVYALSGFVALALELAWFRLLGVVLKSTAFTFGSMLAVYLAGLGAGAAIGALLMRRTRSPGRAFLLLQVGVPLSAAVGMTLLVQALTAGWPAWLSAHVASPEYSVVAAIEAWGALVTGSADEAQRARAMAFAALYGLVPAVLVGLPTLLMGAGMPLLQQAAQADFARLGRRVGGLMTANIAGSAGGAIVTGLVLLPRLGVGGTVALIVATSFVPALLWWRIGTEPLRTPAAALLASAIAVCLVFVPPGDRLWTALHGATPGRVIVAEDTTGVTLLRGSEDRLEGRVLIFANGVSQSWIPFGDVHTALGALPALVHPAPHHVMIIGLGSGDTAFSVAGRRDTRRVTTIEIMGGQLRALERLAAVFPDEGLRGMLGDRRIQHVAGDGRAYLLRSRERFDIIQADVLRPESAYSGHFYSVEYFELLRSRLASHGLAVTWAATERLALTLARVFPHVLRLGPVHIGSADPIAFERAAIEARLRDPGFVHYFARAGVDIVALLTPYLDGAELVGPDAPRANPWELNSDLFPRDEFRLPR